MDIVTTAAIENSSARIGIVIEQGISRALLAREFAFGTTTFTQLVHVEMPPGRCFVRRLHPLVALIPLVFFRVHIPANVAGL